MMRMGLKFFSRTSDRHCFNVAAFHSPHSMTWSWVLSFHFFKSDARRWRPLWWGHRTNDGLQWGCRIPPIGMFTWSRQRPMFYRDLYIRQRDEADRERYVASQKVVHLPTRPTVIDGGKALH